MNSITIKLKQNSQVKLSMSNELDNMTKTLFVSFTLEGPDVEHINFLDYLNDVQDMDFKILEYSTHLRHSADTEE